MKYEVYFEKTFTISVEVEADKGDTESALDKALNVMNERGNENNKEMSQEGYWEHTYTEEEE